MTPESCLGSLRLAVAASELTFCHQPTRQACAFMAAKKQAVLRSRLATVH